MRYFIRLSYDGTRFCGWQRQPNGPSVQQMLEEALATVLRAPTPVVGAGRTDAGVHAQCMWAHFDAAGEVDTERLVRGVDRLCGRDISIVEVRPVRPDAHVRFDARRRTYKYVVARRDSPFLRGRAWCTGTHLDLDAMNEAAGLLLRTSDFTSFAKLHSDARTNICRVDEALWRPADLFWLPADDASVFTISADRFLRNMVRAVVGTLVEVGRGKMSMRQFAEVIERKDRCAAGMSVPAEGLYLWNVEYPKEIFMT